MIRKHGNEYKWIAEMEGYEYLLNPFSSEIYKEKIKEVNDYQEVIFEEFEKYLPKENVLKVDCNPILIDGVAFTKWIAVTDYSHWIVNKFSTKYHLPQLDKMNQDGWNKEMAHIESSQESWWVIVLKKLKQLVH